MTIKQRFQQTPAGKAFFNLSAEESFKTAIDAALLQNLAELPVTDDPVKAAANFHRISGAMAYARILANLGVVDELTSVKTLGQLDHKAK